MLWGSPRHTRVRGAAPLLLALAVSYAAFPSMLPGHAAAAFASVWLTERDDGPAPSPAPAPLHDERDCSLCKAGSSAALAPQLAGLAAALRLAALPGDAGRFSPRALLASSEAPRAPPRALFA